MNTLKRLRTIAESKAAELHMDVDDVLGLAVDAFVRGNPILDADKLKPFEEYENLTGVLVEDSIHEAMEEYAECTLSTNIEGLAERTVKA